MPLPPPEPPPAIVTPAPLSAPLPNWAFGPFTRPAEDAPILTPNPASTFPCPMRAAPIHWESLHTFNPGAIVRDNKVYLLYRAEDDTGSMTIGMHTSRIGLAESPDGLHFTRAPAPVLYPENDAQKDNEWDGGCEDPRVVEAPGPAPTGTYVLTYTQWNRKVPRLAIATSPDLRHWTKHGPAFARFGADTTANMPCKSGSILTKLDTDGRLKAVKVADRYWMYWGEGTIRIAWSDDLVDWHILPALATHPTDPATSNQRRPRVVLAPAPDTFDSPLSECGPPAILTDAGIVLLYNGKNNGHANLPGLAANAYAGGQALFDSADPTRLVGRLSTPFIQPTRPWEQSGQYAAGTTFLEGLVRFQDKWFLYYGCADSRVGVAITQ